MKFQYLSSLPHHNLTDCYLWIAEALHRQFLISCDVELSTFVVCVRGTNSTSRDISLTAREIILNTTLDRDGWSRENLGWMGYCSSNHYINSSSIRVALDCILGDIPIILLQRLQPLEERQTTEGTPKIENKTNSKQYFVSHEDLSKCARVALFNQFCILLPILLLLAATKQNSFGTQRTLLAHFPSWYLFPITSPKGHHRNQALAQLITCVLLQEITFYYSHRILVW